MKYFLSNAFALSLIAVSLTACKGSSSDTSFLNNADIGLVTVGDQTTVKMSSTFNLGNVSLAEIAVPVIDPKTEKSVGTVTFSQIPGGLGKVTLDINTSLMSNGSADLGLVLPNGRAVPTILGASQRGDLFGVNVLQKSRVYIGGDLKTGVTAGVAFVIPALDSVMDQLPTAANIFFLGNYGNVTGMGGIFGSATPEESGIAVFAKYTPPATNKAAFAEQKQIHDVSDFEMEKLDRKTKRRLNRFFYGKHRSIEAK